MSRRLGIIFLVILSFYIICLPPREYKDWKKICTISYAHLPGSYVFYIGNLRGTVFSARLFSIGIGIVPSLSLGIDTQSSTLSRIFEA